MAENTKKYVSLDRLGTFWAQVKEYYSKNSSAKDPVNYAKVAGKLETGRTIGLSSTDNVLTSKATSFDGSTNISIPVTIADATSDLHGLMSANDKAAFDALAKINTVDTTALGPTGRAFSADTVGPSLTFTNGTLSISLPEYALKSEIAKVFKFKGTYATLEDLKKAVEHPTVGDVYHITDKHAEYAYVDGDSTSTNDEDKAGRWEEIGSVINLGTLTIKKSSSSTYTYNGSENITVDLTDIPTADDVAHRIKGTGTPEGTSAASGMILKGSATGDLASTGVAAAKLSNGAVTSGNTSFVEGGTVYTAINDKVDGLAGGKTASTGSYISKVLVSKDASTGKLSLAVEETAASSTVTSTAEATGVTIPVTGKAVVDHVTSELGKLDVSDTAVEGSFVSSVSEADGKISVTRVAASKTVTTTDATTGVKIPVTGEAVKAYVDDNALTEATENEITALFS